MQKKFKVNDYNVINGYKKPFLRKDFIMEFGFNDPVAVDENNVLIEGHGRYIAAEQLGMKELPVIELKHLNEVLKKLVFFVKYIFL